MVKSTERSIFKQGLVYQQKFVSILFTLLLMVSLGSSTDLNNIESITPSGSNPISITGNLDLNNNNINNFFGSSCSTGNIVAHINDDGTLDCVDATGEVQNDFVDRSGDSMTGNLDMSGNNVNNVNKLQLNNIESVSDGQIGRDNSIGYLGNWGSNGNAVLWDSYNVQEGNAISITGGTGDESNPQIAVNEGGINHDNIAGVSYNDHHSVGNGLTWDGSNNPAISSGGVDSNEIASGSVSTTELNTGSVDGRYVNKNGDSMSGNLDLSGNNLNGVNSIDGGGSINFDGNNILFSSNGDYIGDPGGAQFEFEGGGVEIQNSPALSFGDGPPSSGLDMGGYNIQDSSGTLTISSSTSVNGNLDVSQNLDASSGTFTLPTGTDAY